MKKIFLIICLLVAIVKTEAQCPPTVTITGNYSTPLTTASTWIKSSGQTTIVSTANVTLDAHPVNGYVELPATVSTDFFLSAPTTGYFLAVAQTGCTAGTIVKSNEPAAMEISESGADRLSIYPNPTTGITTVIHPGTVKQLSLYDVHGKLILRKNTRGNNQTQLNLTNLPAGIYILHSDKQQSLKIMKE